jgi:hypothetical protein
VVPRGVFFGPALRVTLVLAPAASCPACLPRRAPRPRLALLPFVRASEPSVGLELLRESSGDVVLLSVSKCHAFLLYAILKIRHAIFDIECRTSRGSLDRVTVIQTYVQMLSRIQASAAYERRMIIAVRELAELAKQYQKTEPGDALEALVARMDQERTQ